MLSLSDNAAELLAEAERFDADLHAGLGDVVEATCEEGAAHARAVGQFKDHTGDLRRGVVGFLVSRSDKGATGQIASVMGYSSLVEGGTPAHEIRPKAGEGSVGPLRQGQSRRKKDDIGTSRSALRWEGAGGIRFAKVVHHPGSKPYPFMGPAYLKAQGLLRAKSEALVAKLIERFQG